MFNERYFKVYSICSGHKYIFRKEFRFSFPQNVLQESGLFLLFIQWAIPTGRECTRQGTGRRHSQTFCNGFQIIRMEVYVFLLLVGLGGLCPNSVMSRISTGRWLNEITSALCGVPRVQSRKDTCGQESSFHSSTDTFWSLFFLFYFCKFIIKNFQKKKIPQQNEPDSNIVNFKAQHQACPAASGLPAAPGLSRSIRLPHSTMISLWKMQRTMAILMGKTKKTQTLDRKQRGQIWEEFGVVLNMMKIHYTKF